MTPIAISTLSVDPDGAILIYTDERRSSLGEYARRVQRTATLDASVVVTDNGYTHADRTVRLDVSDESKATQETLRRLVEMYARVLLFLPEGAFTAVPERFVTSGAVSTMTLLIVGPAEVRE